MMPKVKIAFVCSGNTCRSPMAMALFNSLANKKSLNVIASSFGISTITGSVVSNYSVIACKQYDIDISNYRAVSVADVNLSEFSHIYCMSVSHKEILNKFFGVSADKLTVLDIDDPYGCGLDVYKNCCKKLYEIINEIVKKYEN